VLGVTEQLHLADIVGVHGVKGWVKIRAYVEDLKLLTQLSHVMVSPGGNTSSGESRAVQIVEVKPQGKGVIASLKGVNDRTMAETLRGWIIEIPATQLPPAEAGVFYWRDLVGLAVFCRYRDRDVLLGKVLRLVETGANDVLVVGPTSDSIGDKETLIPWVPDDVIVAVDLQQGTIRVDWYLDD